MHDLNISEYIANNKYITSLSDAVAFDVATSEQTYLFIGPPKYIERYSEIKPQLTSFLKYTLTKIFKDSKLTPHENLINFINDPINNIKVKYTESYNYYNFYRYLTSFYYNFNYFSNIRSGAFGNNKNVQTNNFIGLDRKIFFSSNFNERNTVRLEQILVYKNAFLNYLLNYLAYPWFMSNNTYNRFDPKTTQQLQFLELNEVLARVEYLTRNNKNNILRVLSEDISEDFYLEDYKAGSSKIIPKITIDSKLILLYYIYNELKNFNLQSLPGQIPFGLAFLFCNKSNEIVDFKYLENCRLVGVSNTTTLEQPTLTQSLDIEFTNFAPLTMLNKFIDSMKRQY
jgi:hypothetical protein